MSSVIYLDHAAATPIAPEVLAAMQPFFSEQFYNPSAQYGAAREVRRQLEAARARVAHWFGARPTEVVFTAGGTEANNLIIHGVMRCFPEANVVVSAIEHDSVLRPAAQYSHRLAPVKSDGLLDIEACLAAIDDQTVLLSIQYANNEIGTIQPIRQVALAVEQLRARRKQQANDFPLYIHVDACQAPAYLDLHAARLGVDAITINAGKIYGPKQTGALYVRSGVAIAPQIVGGGQERNLRSGTENVANCVGLAAALDLVQDDRHQEVTRLQQLQKSFISQVAALEGVEIHGSLKQRLPNNVHISVSGHDNERLMMELDNQGIICAVGSACSASNEEPSHVLKAIGLSDEVAQSSLRFTMGRQTTQQTVDTVCQALRELTAQSK